jgi:hypothetical protein
MKTNKKNYIFLLLLIIGINTFAQVGIGNTDPSGALDITSTTEGLLIPRVSLTATNVATIESPTISELIYNTSTSAAGPNQVTPGFYYWNGTVWISIKNPNSNKMFSGSYDATSINDATTKNLCTVLQSSGWAVNLVGQGGYWSQKFTIANTNTFSLSGTNAMTPITNNVSTGSSLTSNRVDILYQKNVTQTPSIGNAISQGYHMQGTIEAWTNDGTSKLHLTWWGTEYDVRTVRWNITITNY